MCLSSKDTRHRCHAEYAKIQDIDLSWVDLSAGLIFFVIGIFLSEKVFFLNLSGTPPLTDQRLYFFPLVDRPNQKTSPALDVLKSCTMTVAF